MSEPNHSDGNGSFATLSPPPVSTETHSSCHQPSPDPPNGNGHERRVTHRVTATMLVEALRASSVAPGAPADVPCPPGITIGVYSNDCAQHFNIPSESVQVTRGSIKYVDHHARYGAQTRFRFQLCHNYLLRKCPKLSECSYIHATQLPAPTQVHLNPFAPRRLAADRHGRSAEVAYAEVDDPAVAEKYETMPAGQTIEVHPPQGNQVSAEVTRVPSECLFRTAGAELALKRYAAAGGITRAIDAADVPRHCTKFQYRRACPMGPHCTGIHSKIPFAGTAIDATPPAATAPANSGVATGQPPTPVPSAGPGLRHHPMHTTPLMTPVPPQPPMFAPLTPYSSSTSSLATVGGLFHHSSSPFSTTPSAPSPASPPTLRTPQQHHATTTLPTFFPMTPPSTLTGLTPVANPPLGAMPMGPAAVSPLHASLAASHPQQQQQQLAAMHLAGVPRPPVLGAPHSGLIPPPPMPPSMYGQPAGGAMTTQSPAHGAGGLMQGVAPQLPLPIVPALYVPVS